MSGPGELRGRRVGVIGAGAIGGALIDRLLAVGLPPGALVACETREERAPRHYFLPVFDALIAVALEAGLDRRAAVEAAVATARGTAELVARRPEGPDQLKLITGLRPPEDVAVADLVRKAARAALARMDEVQRGIVGVPVTAPHPEAQEET